MAHLGHPPRAPRRQHPGHVVAILKPLEADIFRIYTDQPQTVDVLPPSLPVPKRLAAKLRQALKQTKNAENPESFLPNPDNFIPF